jgi:hypothetical protein
MEENSVFLFRTMGSHRGFPMPGRRAAQEKLAAPGRRGNWQGVEGLPFQPSPFTLIPETMAAHILQRDIGTSLGE